MDISSTENDLKNRRYGLVKIILSLSPIYVFIGCYIIWLYLGDIGWLSLFTVSMQGQYDILASLVSFLVISISFSVIIFLPSLFLCQSYFLVNNNLLHRTIRMGFLPLISWFSSIITLAFLAFVSWKDLVPDFIKNNSFVFLFSILYIVSFFLVHLVSIKRKRKKEHYVYLSGKRVRYKYFNILRFSVVFAIAFSGVSVVFPLQLIFNFGSAYSYSGIRNALFFSAVISFVSFIPAIFFYTLSTSGQRVTVRIKTSFASSISIFIVALFLLPNVVNIISYNSFKKIGVIDGSEHIYAISTAEYSPDMFPSPVWPHVDKVSGNNFYVKGVSIFSFGESILLCPYFVVKTKELYLKYNFDKFFNDDDFSLKHMRSVAKSCVPVRKTRISRWDAIQDTGNKLNSSEFQVKQ